MESTSGSGLSCSIVIPSYNRGPQLLNTLWTLAHQQCDFGNVEVVVVDDGSTDGTGALLRGRQWPYRFAYLTRPNTGCRAAARNMGVLASRGDVVIFLDAEMLCPPDLLASHLRLHEQYGPCAVCGWERRIARPVSVPLGPEWLAEAHAHSRLSGYVPRPDHRGVVPFITSNASCRRADALEVGLFDEGFHQYGAEDLDLGMRLYLLGRPIVSDRSTVAYHQPHPRAAGLLPGESRNTTRYQSKHHRPRHVLHLVDALTVGGVERHLLGLARHLHGRQHLFRVATAGPAYGFVKGLGQLGVGIDPVAPADVGRLLRAQHPDLIHLHCTVRPNPWLSNTLRLQAHAPLVVTMHVPAELGEHPGLARVVCVSRSTLRLQPGPPDLYRLVYPGIDVPAFAPLGHRAEARERHGLPPGAFAIGTAARLEHWKVSERMMAIYAELARLIPDLHVILLGEGARLAQYREQLSALGLSDRFHLPGPVPDVGDYFEALDLCVHAVEEETFGLAVLEAMAKGLPVVAAATGGLTETVEDGVSGFLCRDGREMAERVLQLAAAPEDRQRMGAEGMRRAKLFDERRTALKHKLVYDEVIDGARYWWPPIAEG